MTSGFNGSPALNEYFRAEKSYAARSRPTKARQAVGGAQNETYFIFGHKA